MGDQWAPIDDGPPPQQPPTPPGQPGQPGPPPAGPPGQPPAPPPSPPPGYYPSPYPPQPKAGSTRTGPLPLHPMTVSDILDGAFKLFKANFKSVVLIVAAISLPLQVVVSFVLRDSFDIGVVDIFSDPTIAESAAEEEMSTAQVATTLAAAFVSLLITPFIAGAISRVVAASYLGSEITAKQALRSTLGRAPALLGSFVLIHLFEAVGFILCVLPGLLLMALYSVAAPAIVAENLGPIAGMRRSWRLVRPRLWPVLGICLLAGVIAQVLSSILSGAPQVVVILFGGSWAWLLIALASLLASMISEPIVAIIATLVYFDARIRQEGLDLQIMAGDLQRAS